MLCGSSSKQSVRYPVYEEGIHNRNFRTRTCRRAILCLLKEPKTLLGKIVSDAWKKFRDWWDRQKRPEIEGNVRKSVLGMLANYKKQVAEESRIRPVPVKNKGMNRD